MKKAKYIALSSVALLLASCASDDVLSTSQEDANAIVFNAVSDVSDIMRGVKVEESEFTSNGFSVYANAMKNGQPTPIMEDTKVSTNDGGTTWNYAPIVYWPNDGSTVDFYGIYQQNFDNRNVLLSYGYDKRPKITYIVPHDIKAHKDILWAPPVLGAKRDDYSSSNPVNFKFQHILAGVSMQVTGVEVTDDFITALKNAADATPGSGVMDNFKTKGYVNKDVLVKDDIKNLTVESIVISGDFPTHGFINPTETDPTKVWLMTYDETEHGGRTYEFGSASLETSNTTVKTKSDANLFLLPSGQTTVKLTVTFTFDLDRTVQTGLVSQKLTGKYRFSITKEDNSCEFQPGKSIDLQLVPDLKKAPSTLSQIP